MVSTTLFCSFSLTGLERLITRETVAIEHPLFFAPELTEFTADKNWQTASESKPYKEPELQTTPKETIIQNIKNIITEIKGDTQ